MSGIQIVIEVVLIGLLGATLLQALRLSRAVGGIHRDRAELEHLIQGFNDSNLHAEAGAERLRLAADAAGRTMNRHIEGASNLKDELTDLIERGERLASRLGTVRTELEPAMAPRRYTPPPEPEMGEATGVRVRSQAERDLLRALRVTR